MTKHRQNPQRRLTPAEADALVAHLSPEERRRKIDAMVLALRVRGVEVEEIFDAAGRSFLKFDLDQVKQVSPDLAALLAEQQMISPEPIAHKTRMA